MTDNVQNESVKSGKHGVMGVGRGTKLKVVFLMVTRRAASDAIGAVATR